MTHAADWRAEGKEDPHGNHYNKERSRLALGDMTDDALANAVFLYGDSTPNMNDVIAGKALMPIAYLTAAKERIRWLSRRLESKLGAKASDLLWDNRDNGRLPEGQTWKDFEIVPLLNGQTCAPEEADTYRLCGITSTVTYWLHTCHSYSEALERKIVLDKLL